MTQPLVPAGVDLRDFPYMPLDVVRLRDSRIAASSSGEGFRCAVLLWCASWHQVPAASLPDDDVLLAQYAGFGRSVREWRKIRQQALYGWIQCCDGRLYHPTVAEKALEAWTQRLQQRWKTECARIKKAAQRGAFQPYYPTFDEWRMYFEATGQEQFSRPPVPGTDEGDGEGDSGALSPGTNGLVPRETASKGREGKGRDISRAEVGDSLASLEDSERARANPPPSADAPPDKPLPTAAGLACRAMRDAGLARTNPHHPDLLAALAEGVTADELADTVREFPSKPLAYVVNAARGRRAEGVHAVAARARAGPNGSERVPKTVQAIRMLEEMKRGLAENRNPGGVPEADLPQLGSTTRR